MLFWSSLFWCMFIWSVLLVWPSIFWSVLIKSVVSTNQILISFLVSTKHTYFDPISFDPFCLHQVTEDDNVLAAKEETNEPQEIQNVKIFIFIFFAQQMHCLTKCVLQKNYQFSLLKCRTKIISLLHLSSSHLIVLIIICILI